MVLLANPNLCAAPALLHWAASDQLQSCCICSAWWWTVQTDWDCLSVTDVRKTSLFRLEYRRSHVCAEEGDSQWLKGNLHVPLCSAGANYKPGAGGGSAVWWRDSVPRQQPVGVPAGALHSCHLSLQLPTLLFYPRPSSLPPSYLYTSMSSSSLQCLHTSFFIFCSQINGEQ